MRLSDFLSEQHIRRDEFGRQIGVSSEAVRRYCDGTRTPKSDTMKKIFDATDGRVTPNDFAGIPSVASSAETGDAA